MRKRGYQIRFIVNVRGGSSETMSRAPSVPDRLTAQRRRNLLGIVLVHLLEGSSLTVGQNLEF
jgi:hypothetical protein